MASPALPFAFDSTAPDAQRVAQRYAARAVTNVSAETKRAIRAIVVRSIREGIPPYDAARLIRAIVGLTKPAALAVMRYRGELLEQGIAPGRVRTLIERYSAKLLRERSITIARTEIMHALNEGARQTWKQAQKDGYLGDGARKVWIVTPDEILARCPICRPMEDVSVPLNENFITPVGPLPGPPAHPRCRCTHSIEP
jgi:hypothetical protein